MFGLLKSDIKESVHNNVNLALQYSLLAVTKKCQKVSGNIFGFSSVFGHIFSKIWKKSQNVTVGE